jgi:putative ABC transport system ATP-binding protein
MMNAATYAIRASGIVRHFVTGKVVHTVLDGVDLAIEAGQLTLMMGPSGSGKSTLLAVISGLLRPDAGQVEAMGVDLWRLSDKRIDAFRLANCGFVFQGFNLFPALTAEEQVALPLTYQGLKSAEARRRAVEALDAVGLEARRHLRPLELSGGEKQRVAIARALAKQPQLIFADEPTSALDSANGQTVVRLLHEAARSRGAAVLCVTHDPRLVAHADRVVSLEDGQIRSDDGAPPVALPSPSTAI